METRLYKAGAVQSIPSMASLISAGYPTGGDPVRGIAATKPGDAWYYGIGEEIRNVILAAGLTPSNNDLDQLAQAIEILAGKHGFATGDLKPLISNTITNGWLLSNGAVVSRSANPKLVQYAYDNDFVRSASEQAEYEANPATFTGKIYGPGDGSTTIQIPDMRGRSLMGATSSATVGRYQPEQLPNVNGSFLPETRTNADGGTIHTNFTADVPGSLNGGVHGAIYANRSSWGGDIKNTGSAEGFIFDASESNSIYTDSGVVRPLGLALNYIIRT